jgi:F-type H+-transporting ATPase subunit b
VIPLESNFLVPNGTFIVELIAFAIMFFIIARYIVPPINKAMEARQAAIRAQFTELEQAKADAESDKAAYAAQLNEARQEANRIREEARAQGVTIVSSARDQAVAEQARVVEQGKSQLEAERQQAAHSLRSDVGSLATTLAGKIVGESLEDSAVQSRVVERFLADLEATGN